MNPIALSRREFLSRTAGAGIAMTAAGLLLPRNAIAMPEPIVQKGRKVFDVAVHCSDSRLRGTPWHEAVKQMEDHFNPHWVMTPGTAATPALVKHLEHVFREIREKHGDVTFRVHVVGHGTMRKQGERYLQAQEGPQCGMQKRGEFVKELIDAAVEQGFVTAGKQRIAIASHEQAEQALKQYYGLPGTPSELFHNIPKIHQHVVVEAQAFRKALAKAANRRLEVYAGVEEHGGLHEGPAYAYRAMGRPDEVMAELYARAQANFKKMPKAEQEKERKAKNDPQHPQVHIIFDEDLETNPAEIAASKLGLKLAPGQQFMTMHPEERDILSDAADAYHLLHLTHGTGKTPKLVIVSKNPTQLLETLQASPIFSLALEKVHGKVNIVKVRAK